MPSAGVRRWTKSFRDGGLLLLISMLTHRYRDDGERMWSYHSAADEVHSIIYRIAVLLRAEEPREMCAQRLRNSNLIPHSASLSSSFILALLSFPRLPLRVRRNNGDVQEANPFHISASTARVCARDFPFLIVAASSGSHHRSPKR